ncbi:MAG: type I methionyl aminopeptidase [Endomicrobium sp.]|nr:type I methionyl aminopeptidase [Endomicrobium sp.]
MFLKKQGVKLKTPIEIEKMRNAGKVVGEILNDLSEIIRPGITTKDIDIFSEKCIRLSKMKPAFLGIIGRSYPFPATTCVSVNNEVVHGIPNSLKVLEYGDLVSVDIGVVCEGYYGDAAKTYVVGSCVSETAVRLIKIAELSLHEGISQILPGKKLGDVSSAIQRTVETNGFSVVRDFVGHGIGVSLHEEPQIPNFGEANTGIKLIPGMVLAIEPMVNVGDYQVCTESDGWTVTTKDGSLSAHFEHTIAVTENGYEILTKV